jgi:hypothetical protein
MREMYWKWRLKGLKIYRSLSSKVVYLEFDDGLKLYGDTSMLGMLYDQITKKYMKNTTNLTKRII